MIVSRSNCTAPEQTASRQKILGPNEKTRRLIPGAKFQDLDPALRTDAVEGRKRNQFILIESEWSQPDFSILVWNSVIYTSGCCVKVKHQACILATNWTKTCNNYTNDSVSSFSVHFVETKICMLFNRLLVSFSSFIIIIFFSSLATKFHQIFKSTKKKNFKIRPISVIFNVK